MKISDSKVLSLPKYHAPETTVLHFSPSSVLCSSLDGDYPGVSQDKVEPQTGWFSY